MEMIDIGNMYLIPLTVGFFYGIIRLLMKQTLRYEKKFENRYSNLLFSLGEMYPFRWFIETDPRNAKVRQWEALIKVAELTHQLDYRSVTVLQISLMFVGITIYFFLSILLTPLISLLASLFNLDAATLLENETTILLIRIVFGVISVIPVLAIKPWMKRRNASKEVDFLTDLPLLQQFIVLMLRSGKTINEVLYVLSTTNTSYQDAFREAYRIYLREPIEGFDYLEDQFIGTKLLETIYTLRDFTEYGKEESIITLENNQDDILEYSANARKKAEAGKNLLANISVAFPFVSVLLLGAGPIAAWAIKLLSSSSLMMSM